MVLIILVLNFLCKIHINGKVINNNTICAIIMALLRRVCKDRLYSVNISEYFLCAAINSYLKPGNSLPNEVPFTLSLVLGNLIYVIQP